MKPILVVDDDPAVRELLRRMIESLGRSVIAAEDATTALARLEETPVDLALCDMRMPGHDGAWLVDQILARYPTTPVAVATGLVEMDPAVTLRPGVVGYVVKPFRRSVIAEMLRLAESAAPPAGPREQDLLHALSSFDI